MCKVGFTDSVSESKKTSSDEYVRNACMFVCMFAHMLHSELCTYINIHAYRICTYAYTNTSVQNSILPIPE